MDIIMTSMNNNHINMISVEKYPLKTILKSKLNTLHTFEVIFVRKSKRLAINLLHISENT